MIDDDFGNWLAGFIDGEGCFLIRKRMDGRGRNKDNYGYSCDLVIQLRQDDADILLEIQKNTRLGKITYNRAYGSTQQNNTVKWRVGAKSELLQIVALLDRFPLRAKKKKDYEIWKRAVMEHSNKYGKNNDWTLMDALEKELKEVRKYEDKT